MMKLNELKTNLQSFLKKRESNYEDSPEKDDFSDDCWSEGEFSDIESGDDVAVYEDLDHYNDVSTTTYHNHDVGTEDQDVYQNLGPVVKSNEMQETTATIPPRKTENVPKPPARRKKKLPPLPEKLHTEPEDNQFYEDLDRITLGLPAPAPPTKSLPDPTKHTLDDQLTESMQPQPTIYQQNRSSYHAKGEENGNHQPTPPSKLPPRRMPAIPPMTSKDTTPICGAKTFSPALPPPRLESAKEKLDENPLHAFPWYHGDNERSIVENKLLKYKRDGMFAVRSSVTKGPSYPYVVTLYHNGKTFNFPIRIRDSDKLFALGTGKKDEPCFEKVKNLIDYFKKNKIKLMNNQFAVLNIPLNRFS